jgi:uncharacterized membrane protein
MMFSAVAGITADTTTERVLVVVLGAGILLGMLAVVWRRFARTFFHGFLVAAGVFLSVDIVVFHWTFRLHRITAGPEANVIEPVLVVVGLGFITHGLLRERAAAGGAPATSQHLVDASRSRRQP